MKKNAHNYDLIGVLSAALCLLHCLVTPLLLGASGFLGLSGVLCYAFAALGVWAAFHVTRGDVPLYLKLLIRGNMGLLILAIFLESFLHIGHTLVYISAIGLLIGHSINFALKHAPRSRAHRPLVRDPLSIRRIHSR